MHIKALTVKGFKSFGEKADLIFSNGVTAVVGPNGSGKSNIVDAIAWVLGSQTAKSLRGAKMDDVIFAGTSKKSALGRAEVEITFDNEDQSIPLEFSEVTVKRTLYRSGESEYELNRTPCRLIDIQELLSDAGIGKQQHVIVGQGKLDAILQAKPEDRRAVIEEAAGVLKYRKRKEKAQRRLYSDESDITRLKDLLREIKRQIKPLEKQADAAKQYQSLKSELETFAKFSDLNNYRIDKEKVTSQRAKLTELNKKENELKTQIAQIENDLEKSSSVNSFQKLEELNNAVFELQAYKDRVISLNQKITLKISKLEAYINNNEAEQAATELKTLLPKIASTEEQIFECENEIDLIAETTAQIEKKLSEYEVISNENNDNSQDFIKDFWNKQNQLKNMDSSIEEIQSSISKLNNKLKSLLDLQEFSEEKNKQLLSEVNELKQKLENNKNELPDIENQIIKIESTINQSEKNVTDLNQKFISQKAKVETLQNISITNEQDYKTLSGWDGFVEDKVDVKDGYETQVAAAFSTIFNASIFSRSEVKKATEYFKENKQDAIFVVLDDEKPIKSEKIKSAKPLLDCIKISGKSLTKKLENIFVNHFIVDDINVAIEHNSKYPNCSFITSDGDVVSSNGIWHVTNSEKVLATKKSQDRAIKKMDALQEQLNSSKKELENLKSQLNSKKVQVNQTQKEINKIENEIEINNIKFQQLENDKQQYEIQLDEINSEVSLLESKQTELNIEKNALKEFVALNSEKYEALANRDSEINEEVQQLQLNFTNSNEKINESKILLATLNERAEGYITRQKELQTIIQNHKEEEAAQSSEGESSNSQTRASKLFNLKELREKCNNAIAKIQNEITQINEKKTIFNEELSNLKNSVNQIKSKLENHKNDLESTILEKQSCEIKIAELNVKINQNEVGLWEKYEISTSEDLDELISNIELPTLPEATSLQSHLLNLQQKLNFLGPINPLAEKEFDELNERYNFLSDQLEDVNSSKKECQKIITSIDDDIELTFTQAFDKVKVHFAELFEVLFPNGYGEVKLVDEGAGVDLIAKPAGKNINKLSLLSGGERSLASMAFLFAVFKAAPSPFYVLDEVEAALDDVNLQRFINLLQVFKEQTQLIVITHQKRTMKAANVLYGVTMSSGSGITKVVSQKIEDVEDSDIISATNNDESSLDLVDIGSTK